MIKKIHFDPQRPENHNIYISNLKNKYVMVYDGEKWNIQDQNEVISDMIDDNTIILEDKIEEWLAGDIQPPNVVKKFRHYLNKKEDSAILNRIKREVKFVLFNNRGVATGK